MRGGWTGRGHARMLPVQRRGGNAVASSPLAHVLVPIHDHRHLLVEARERAVVAFVQAPVAYRRDPQLSDLFEDHVARLDRTLQDAGEGHVEPDAGLPAEHPRAVRIVEALPTQRHIHPRGEAVVLVPDRHAVPHKDEADQVVAQLREQAPRMIGTGRPRRSDAGRRRCAATRARGRAR